MNRDISPMPDVFTDGHKLLQIFVNLVSNARHALMAGLNPNRLLIVTGRLNGSLMKIEIIDSGVGIPAENLDRIFNYGFTTKKNGHGFGLHSSALAAKELGGTLIAESASLHRSMSSAMEATT